MSEIGLSKEKERIHFEVQRITGTYNFRGIGHYELNLLKKLIERDHYHYEISLFDYNKERGNRVVVENRIGRLKDKIEIYECNHISYKEVMSSCETGDLSLFEGKDYGTYLELKNKPRLFHFMNSNMFPLNAPDNSIITAHDCMGILPNSKEHFSEQFQKAYLNCQKKIEKNKRITVIADSESTKNDLTKFFDIEPERILIVPLGVDGGFYNKKSDPAVIKKYDITKPYLFYVGAVEERKGVFDLLEAFKIIKLRYKDLQLIFAGGMSKKNSVLYEGKFDEKDVKYLGYISDEEKRALLSDAEAFVFPSRYEGFGLPVLEAMSCRCPVITCNVSSIPEVGGDSVEYVNPGDVEGLVFAIESLLDDRKKREELGKKGLARARLFTWDRCAEETEKAYDFAVNRLSQ